MSLVIRLPILTLALALLLPFAIQAEDAGRSSQGLLALYDFQETEGDWVRDVSGAGEPLDLKIHDAKSIKRAKGALEITGKADIRSEGAAKRITDAIKRSGEFTLEAWLRPADTKQEGPARIVTISKTTSTRNVTLGQEYDRFDVRFRTTKTSSNGMPSLSSPKKSLKPELVHLVYSKDGKGRARIFLNGETVADRKIDGEPKNWDGNFQLALGNEVTKDRPWKGTFHLVALYDRELEPGEIAKHFQAGVDAESPPASGAAVVSAEDRKLREQEHYFTTEVAPLLTEHCLECHDSSTRKGKLDLSRKDEAMTESILPGRALDSPLWASIEEDEMPKKRPPLSAEEKEVLKKWIDSGATWAQDRIDPAIYTHQESATQLWVQRLTVEEYIETVRATVGVDISKQAKEILPPDLRADGFSNTAYNLNVDLKHVESYAKLAEQIVQQMDVQTFIKRFASNRSIEDKNVRNTVDKMGLWMLRGPLSKNEVDLYRGITTTVSATGGDFEDAMSYVIEAMLQSPRFIYRIEQQEGNGSLREADSYEIASRLSYIIWGASPDRELYDAANKDRLEDAKAIEDEVSRMLRDPRAVTRSTQFVSEWLNLDRLGNLRPNAKKHPAWSPQLGREMEAETLAFFREVVWEQERPMSDLLNAQLTVATPMLARHYGLDVQNEPMAIYDLSQTASRGGLLTQGAVLTIGGDEASMVARGLFVLHDLMRGVVKDPPPCVDTTPVPTKAGLTQRSIAQDRIANKNCGGCHAKFEPLAFGLEKYDGIGMFHDTDRHGNALRDDGEILFPGEAEPIQYQSSAELMDLLAESERVRESITWKLTQFALGRPLSALDAPEMDKIHAEAQKHGGTYQSLIRAIALSDLVRKTRTVPSS